jgi:hypothetical protein
VRPSRLIVAALLALGTTVPLAVQNAEPATAMTWRGRGVASAMYLKTQPDKLLRAGAGWSYNWTYRVPASTPALDVVPMIRSASSLTNDAVSTLTRAKNDGDNKFLLGFNEPDSKNQANMTPTQAANLWPKLQQTGLVLGSPTPANVTNGWLKQFLELARARHLRVDFIALHFYANITDTNALARIKQQVEAVRAHYGKPIWITEIGIIDTRTNPGSASVNWARSVKFMRAVTAMLDSKTYVHRYAWMADNVSSRPNLRWSTLYDANGRLTPLGTAYSQLSQ